MSAIDNLKNVKVPWHARWIGLYRAWKRRRAAYKEIYHIATVYAWTHWIDTTSYSYQWYICKVDGTGKRFYEHGSNHPVLRGRVKDNQIYASVIEPWRLGAWTHQQIQDYAVKSVKHPAEAK